MMKTKNDLSYQEAVLDYEAMREVATIAICEIRERVQGYNSQLANAISDGDTTLLRRIPEQMENEIKKLRTCGETLSVLIGGKERAYANIVNRNITAEAQKYLDDVDAF